MKDGLYELDVDLANYGKDIVMRNFIQHIYDVGVDDIIDRRW